MNKKHPTIASDVLDQIKRGDVKMRPGIYFTMLSVFTLLASIAAGMAMSYMSSVVFFWIKIVGSNTNAYGARRNLSELLVTFPWWTIVAFAVLLTFTVVLVRQYGDNYRYKTRDIVLFMIAALLLVGFVMSNLGISGLGHSVQHYDVQAPGYWYKNK